MPYLETPDELAEQIADWCGVYGCGNYVAGHFDDCNCRMCFTGTLAARIRQAVKNEEILNKQSASRITLT